MDSKTEKNSAADKTNNRKYFTMIPRMVVLKSRSPYDVIAWMTVMDVAGEHGECDYSTDELAALAMMSSGKFSDCRAYLISEKLLEGWIETQLKGQSKWHLTVPDLWEENIKLSKRINTIEKRINYNKDYRLSDTKKPSPHEGLKPSPHEGLPSPHEGSSFIEKNLLEEPIIKTECGESLFEDFLVFWNSLDIIVHTIAPRDEKAESGRRTFYEAVSSRLNEGHSWDALKTSAQNYADILHSSDHRFKFRWTITQFINRGFDQFLDRKTAWENYKKSNFEKKGKTFNEQQSDSLRLYREACEVDALSH